MKFFLGIVPPLVTKERILNFQKSFPTNMVPFFNEPHITIKAPGGLTEDKSWLLKTMVLIGDYPRFQIKFDAVESFEDQVLFLKPQRTEELINLHLKLVSLLNPDEETNKTFFEGDLYEPHLTLGKGGESGMSSEDFQNMKKRLEFELQDIPPFQVDFVRVYQKDLSGDPYIKLLDIPLKL